MNILVISNLYPPHFLGWYEILCGQVCDVLNLRGNKITVLTTNHGMEKKYISPEICGNGKISVHRMLRLYQPFGQASQLMRKERWRTGKYNKRITQEIIANLQPDVIFIWSQLRLTLGVSHAAQSSGIPVTYTRNDEHLTGFKPSGFSWHPRRLAGYILDRWVYPSNTYRNLTFPHVTCISKRLKDNLTKEDVPVDQAKVIYQAIPLNKFPYRGDSTPLSSPVRVLYIGQLHHDKGV